MSELDDQLGRLERIAAAQLHQINRDPVEALRTLPEVVEASASIWDALPEAPDSAASDPMERLMRVSRTMGQVLQAGTARHIPGPRWDDGLLPIAEPLTETENLRHSSDPDGARRQLMYIVQLSAHAARSRVTSRLTGPRTSVQHRDLLQRGLAEAIAIDELAGSYLRQGSARPLPIGAGVVDPQTRVDLGLAMARCDLAAGRAISTANDPHTLVRLASAQTMTYTALQPLLRAISPPDGHRDLLLDRIDQAGHAWSEFGLFWQDLQTPRASYSGEGGLLQARLELHAAFRDLLFAPDGRPRSPDETASMLDVTDTLESIHQTLVSTAAHARAVDDLTREPRQIQVSACAAQRALTAHLAADGKPTAALSQDRSAAISPRDLLLDRPVPLPNALHRPAQDLSTATQRASTAAFHASGLVPTPEVARPLELGTFRRPEHRKVTMEVTVDRPNRPASP